MYLLCLYPHFFISTVFHVCSRIRIRIYVPVGISSSKESLMYEKRFLQSKAPKALRVAIDRLLTRWTILAENFGLTNTAGLIILLCVCFPFSRVKTDDLIKYSYLAFLINLSVSYVDWDQLQTLLLGRCRYWYAICLWAACFTMRLG